jgi:putative GTP pyrophosphokinase
MKDHILDSYKQNKKTYNAFRERVVNLLTDLLLVQEISIHQIGGRTKTIESLSKKIDEKGDKYIAIEDITDIVGVRIITYMESDVDAVADLIEKEFIKDIENSIDKRKLKADQFGYRSLHIVASLNKSRCDLKEYRRYKGIKCEIQVRSILQHAWAEIEHDLGYKGENTIPEDYRRTFNRLSALLESADIEFDRLKTDLTNYEVGVPELIKSEPELVDVNKASLNSLLKTNSIFLKANQCIKEITGMALKEVDLPDSVVTRAKYLGFKNIADIEKALLNEEEIYLKFVKQIIKDYPTGRPGQSSTALIFFFDYLIIRTEDSLAINTYYKYIGVGELDESEYKRRVQFYKSSL